MANAIRLPFLFYRRNGIQKRAVSADVQPLTRAEQIATGIIRLFETEGRKSYGSTSICQTEHMVQCAMLAMNGMSDLPVIIGALLHDIGHLLTPEHVQQTKNAFGIAHHESIGAAYLRRNGFSERVCAIVENHVAAKRYLVALDATYHRKLTPASLQTLRWQGGPMTSDEMAAFERQPYFNDSIKVRRWDEAANETNVELLPVAWFYRLLWDHLSLRVA